MAVEILGSGQPDGTSVVKATTEKASIYGGTPVVQAATIVDAVAATGITATAGAIMSGTGGTFACSNADHAALVAIINTLLDDLSDLGITAA